MLGRVKDLRHQNYHYERTNNHAKQTYFSGHDFIETLAPICFISPNHMAPKARRRVAPTRLPCCSLTKAGHVVASAETEALRIGGSFPDAASCHAEVAERRRKSDEDGLVTP